MSLRHGIFRMKSGYVLLVWLVPLLLIFSTVVVPYKIATVGHTYPDLNILLICYSVAGLLWIAILFEFGKKTLSVTLNGADFTVKKIGQKTRQYPYTVILAQNERHESGRGGPFNELTVYLSDNWFAIRSNEFRDYDYLKEQFTQYGQSVPYRTVLTLSERNRLRWMVVGLVLLIGTTIAFGYLAHNPADPNPARLISLTSTVSQVGENRNKGPLKGVTIHLRAFPSFAFYVSRRDYNVRLETLKSVIRTNHSITLLIRQSDFRKKLQRTEPLTIRDN